ncbi:hypothetical protein OHA72_40085 [Dactylosporangium sp. NBC_01737]|nr:hypothetical protein OHA72_40085 [Dactylosporangium sp. NBC_01737]
MATVVLGVAGVLGPAAMVVYLLLPLWLIAASVITSSPRSPVLTASA